MIPSVPSERLRPRPDAATLRDSGQSEAAPPSMITTPANISLSMYLCGHALYFIAYMYLYLHPGHRALPRQSHSAFP